MSDKTKKLELLLKESKILFENEKLLVNDFLYNVNHKCSLQSIKTSYINYSSYIRNMSTLNKPYNKSVFKEVDKICEGEYYDN